MDPLPGLTAIGHDLQQMLSGLDRLDRMLPGREKRTRSATQGPPVAFIRHADEGHRFELRYPSDWKVAPGPGFQATSRRMGSFIRVDLSGTTVDLWRPLELDVQRRGARFSARTLSAGPSPERARGEITLGAARFTWTATGWTVGDTKVVLVLGQRIAPRPGPAMAAYQKQTLAAIRRHFKIGPGLRG